MSDWLQPPYYTLPPKEFVDLGAFFGKQPTAEARMQDLTNQLLGYPAGFVFGAAGSGADTPDKLLQEMTDFAVSLTQAPFSKVTAADFDPQARAKYYFEVVVSTLKKIPASNWDWMNTGSVYDVWIARNNA